MGRALVHLSKVTLSWCLIVYGLAASVLPVWLLLAPRDYLSTFMKVGTIAPLAVGILLARPVMQAPAISQFAKSARDRSSRARCSRSCSSPSPAGRCLASTR